ncbi:MAG: glycosyltransferase, partial [Pseudomonadota bacterium]
DGKVRSIRSYGVGGSLAEIPRLAGKYRMTVALGAWLTSDHQENEREVEKVIEIARRHKNVVRVFVGNETVLRGELSPEQLILYLDKVRFALKVPVSTAEPWHVWRKHPELGKHVDFIGAHMLPYWEGVHLDIAIEYVIDKYNLLHGHFPGRPVVLAEVGWPSNGRTRRSAVASQASQAIFLRRFLEKAHVAKYDYYLMEAFDQPWKSESEGAVGAYWGVYDVYRNQKFAFTEPIVRVAQWKILAAASVVLAALALWMLLIDGGTLRNRARSFLAATAHGVGAGIVWVAYDYANQYLTPFTVTVGIVLSMGFLGINLVILTEAHEWAESNWVTRRRRFFGPSRPPAGGETFLPKVSIHVPAYNEPPEMMIETLNAVACLKYPNFEVLVIDNNTKEPAMWKPVEAHCRALGERFRFFHVDPLSGFKAGALNFALMHTAQDAEIIAVIDSDYQVQPSWLADLVPHFVRSEIGLVQAPQDYRDGGENLFKAMCYAEYRGFFHIGMVTRNDRNAIIEHGTMTMIRARVLREVGGWAEWCITEDAELGLRIFEHGYESAYVETSYGKGLIPDTFLDYKKQRFRWAYGAVQIMRRHAKEFLGCEQSRLTPGQRYHFLAGWLPWLADGLNLFYTAGALIWSAAIIMDPNHVDPPLAIFTIPPMALFFFKVVKMAHIYRTRVGATRWETTAAALAGLSLSHTIAKAVILGFFTKDMPFFRTPKCENRPALVQAFVVASEELSLALGLWVASLGVALTQGRETPGSLLWSAALVVQSLPYLAAFLVSVINGLPSEKTRKSFHGKPMVIPTAH